MKSVVILVGLLAVFASAEWIEIDWSKVRRIEEFDHYWEGLPAEMQRLRDTDRSNRVTNGQEATPGQFPFQTAMVTEFAHRGNGLCGGSVLTQNYVLTAGHCVVSDAILATGGTAIMGAHNRQVQEASQQRIRYSQSGIIPHPQYNRTNIRNDIAVVRLDSPMTFTERIQPIRLPARSDTRQFGGFIGTVSGFGRTADGSSSSPVIMYASNPVMTNADCLTRWSSSVVQDQNVCLSADGGRSACNGDSGGPLTVQSGGSMQIGVVSFGSSNGCTHGTPSVYARVSYFLSFIEANSDFVADP